MFIFMHLYNCVYSWSFAEDPNTVAQTTCTTGSASTVDVPWEEDNEYTT